jgi:trimeric autotransporter adhesin
MQLASSPQNLKILSTTNSLNCSPLRHTFLLIPFALACFALSPHAQAIEPPPDGGYPGQNTAEGTDALFSLIPGEFTGVHNTAVGFDTLYSTVTGSYNTAIGDSALISNISDYNTAIGAVTLYYNTSGEANTAIGAFALISNTTGDNNTATGDDALFYNTTGMYNTASGTAALYRNASGSSNTAMGSYALLENTMGANNTALGFQALAGDPVSATSTGNNNTASGYQALFSYTTGSNNTANGYQALYGNKSGNGNTANGQGTLFSNTTGRNNTADGQNAMRSNTTGNNNTALGSNAGINLTTGSNNIEIGDPGVAGEANTIRIGRQATQTKTFIAGISGATVPTGVAVMADTNGQLGTVVSSKRFKDNVQPMDQVSEAILALKPVTFRYKKELDPDGIPQFGLIAEDVEKVNSDLVARDQQGKPYTVRYEAVNAMLLNEFLKEHRKVEELEAKLAEQEKDFTARLKEQDAKIQQVNDKLN